MKWREYGQTFKDKTVSRLLPRQKRGGGDGRSRVEYFSRDAAALACRGAHAVFGASTPLAESATSLHSAPPSKEVLHEGARQALEAIQNISSLLQERRAAAP
nr:hypothetical protein [Tepidiphilus olei]